MYVHIYICISIYMCVCVCAMRAVWQVFLSEGAAGANAVPVFIGDSLSRCILLETAHKPGCSLRFGECNYALLGE